MKLRVIVPCYNEKDVLHQTIQQLIGILEKDSVAQVYESMICCLLMTGVTIIRLQYFKRQPMKRNILNISHLVEILVKKQQCLQDLNIV